MLPLKNKPPKGRILIKEFLRETTRDYKSPLLNKLTSKAFLLCCFRLNWETPAVYPGHSADPGGSRPCWRSQLLVLTDHTFLIAMPQDTGEKSTRGSALKWNFWSPNKQVKRSPLWHWSFKIPHSLTCSVLWFAHNVWTLSVKPFENAALAPCCHLPAHSLGPSSPYAAACCCWCSASFHCDLIGSSWSCC